MPYSLPSPTDYVSSDWADHAYRSPPSSEPGTDYACSYGSAVYAPDDGVVVDVNFSPSGGTGRYVAIDLNDGRRTRTLHMSEVWVNVGQRVGQGNQVGVSGASGYGDDWYYGPHVHQTLWDYWGYNFCSTCTIDFEPYVGDTAPPPIIDMEDEMIRIQSTNRGIALIGPGYFRGLTSDEEVINSEPLVSKHITGNDRQFDLWRSMAVDGAAPGQKAVNDD